MGGTFLVDRKLTLLKLHMNSLGLIQARDILTTAKHVLFFSRGKARRVLVRLVVLVTNLMATRHGAQTAVPLVGRC